MVDSRNYGLIGVGMMGREHIQNLALIEGATLVSMSDPHPASLTAAQEVCEASGITDVRAYSNYSDMLSREALDAVIVASPNHTHAAIVMDLLETDLALLVEKPLCTTIIDAERVADRANARPHLFWTGLEYRYMPPVAEFIRRVHAGGVGTLKTLSIREHRFPFLKKIGDWNRFSRNTGGTLVEKCCHFFDLMRVIIQSEPVRIYASGAMDVNHKDERYGGETPDILDNAFAIVDFENGVRAQLDLCMFAEGSEDQEEICAIGDAAKMEVKIPTARLITSPRIGFGKPKQITTETIETQAALLSAGHHHGGTYFQLRDFHTAMIEGRPPTVSALDGLRSVAMGAAAHQSIETGQAVEVSFS